MALKVWLPLTGTLENLGISNITFSGIPVWRTPGKIGTSAYNLSTRVTFNCPALANVKYFSIAFWGMTEANADSTANWMDVLSFTDKSTGGTTGYFRFETGYGSTTYGGIHWHDNATNAIINGSYTYNNASEYGKWHHIVVTVSETAVCSYYDGVLKSTLTTNLGGGSLTGAGWIGESTTRGGIQDIRVYDHCLSAAEVKEIAQGLVLHYKLDDITNGIQDSSGYGHNGTIVGTATINIDTPRYSYSTSMNTVSTTNHIESINTLPSTIQTISFWMKNLGQSNYVVFAEPSSGLMFAPIGSYAVIKVATSNQTCYAISSPYYIDGAWNHIVVQKDGTTYKLWTNGTLRGTSGSNYYRHDGDKLYLFNRNYNSNYGSNCIISDFRAYTTLLSEDDIKQLYNVGMKVDKSQNIHTYEFNENGSNKLTKTGILKNYAIEPFLTLADGSKWQLMLYHYVDGGNNLFTSSNATFCNNFGLYSRLAYINNFTYDNKYEFYVLQDDKQFRWTQTSQPTASSIAGLTTVSGYTNPVNGLAKASQSNTYIGYSSWWGACGCWTSYSTGGKTGIPGFGSHDANGICTTYLALYARVNNFNAKIANLSSYANNLIEF